MTAIRECTHDDVSALQEIARTTYKDTFAQYMESEANMDAYLKAAFSLEKLQGELDNAASSFFFLYHQGVPAGYLKLNEHGAQTDIHDPLSLELERIYVASAFQSRGFGQMLLDFAVQTAYKRNKAYIWLGVWVKNEKALAFYKKNGFYKIGVHLFVMGDETQTDYILRKDLV